MKFNYLLKLIDQSKPITIISNNLNYNSDVARLYFALYHNPKYSSLISMTKNIVVNHNYRLSVRGKINKKEDMKQIHFVNIKNLEKWMLETDKRIDKKLDENETIKKFKIHSKIMFEQRVIILLDDVEIPDKLNPSKVVVGGICDTTEHYKWKMYLQKLINKYNDLYSQYFKLDCKQNEFKELTEEQIKIVRESDKHHEKIDGFEFIDPNDVTTFIVNEDSEEDNEEENKTIEIYDTNDDESMSILEKLEKQIKYVMTQEPNPKNPL